MSAPLLALCAALSWSLGSICVRLGSRSVAPLVGVVLTLVASCTVLVTGLLMRGVAEFDLAAVGLFALAGVAGPCIGRILSITSIARLGATRASPVKSAAQPVVAVLLGIVVLSETLAPSRLTGIALTLGGVVLVVAAGQRERARVPAGDVRSDSFEAPGVSSLRLLVWPIGAGTAFACADLVRKYAIERLDDVFLGGAIGVLVALSIWGTVLLSRGQGPDLARHLRSRDAVWFLASGMGSGAAQVFVLSALREGDLSLVAPIVATQPILIALLSRVFINRLERVGLVVGVAAVLATAGTILLSL